MISKEAAISAYPQLARLVELEQAGWAFRPFNDESGVPIGLVGWQQEGDAVDALWVFARDHCRAARLVLGDGGGITWELSGDIEACVDKLLALPRPGERTAPRLVRARASQLWTP